MSACVCKFSFLGDDRNQFVRGVESSTARTQRGAAHTGASTTQIKSNTKLRFISAIVLPVCVGYNANSLPVQ